MTHISKTATMNDKLKHYKNRRNKYVEVASKSNLSSLPLSVKTFTSVVSEIQSKLKTLFQFHMSTPSLPEHS